MKFEIILFNDLLEICLFLDDRHLHENVIFGFNKMELRKAVHSRVAIEEIPLNATESNSCFYQFMENKSGHLMGIIFQT